MSCKSLLYTVLNQTVDVAAGGIVPIGNPVRRVGKAIRQDGNAVTLLEPGYYTIAVLLNTQPVADTAITARVEENGVPLAGAFATTTPNAAAADTDIVIPAAVSRVYCSGTKTITVTLDAAAAVTGATVTVEKV